MKLTNEALRALNMNSLTAQQREFAELKLSGQSCRTIAETHGVSLQCVYKTLWKAIDSSHTVVERPEYAQLTRPQMRCVYKNLALEMRKRDVKSCDIALKLGVARNVMSNYIYGKKGLPLSSAIEIQREFFPDLTLEYLFAKANPDVVYSTQHVDISTLPCVYPRIKEAIDSGALTISQMAVAIQSVEGDLATKLSHSTITIDEATVLRDAFFPNVEIPVLFAR